MLAAEHAKLSDDIWAIANKLRGPYRPPQYRRVMLPLIVLRRLDCVLADTKSAVRQKYEALTQRGLSDEAVHKALARVASPDRNQPLYNVSAYTFPTLLDEPDAVARNLTAYINGFSPTVRRIFEKFEFEKEIEKLDEANRLFEIIKIFANLDLHPDHVSNLAMGYVFENLIRRFNEQANEEAGDHFTPREVITLMAHLLYTGDEDVYTPGIGRTIYHPSCGTGGMLSVSEAYIREHNPDANLTLYGQDYNAEAYAICCSDMLIKDEPVDNIVHGDTLGDGKSEDGHKGKTFHYMLANPPFGVEWSAQEKLVKKEHDSFGFKGRFGPGTPRKNDGALLFLLHMLDKRKLSPEYGGEGSRIAIVFNGSPLFTGDAGSGESNIRRWIIENDWLDAIVALPDQLFYNTGIYTYVWLVTNRKPEERRGKVQLIDGTRHFQKMKKSLGNKRNELSDEQIADLTRLYAAFDHDATTTVMVDGEPKERICSKIFDNREFGYIKLTIERPLRLNFQANPERVARVSEQSAFAKLATSKKTKNKSLAEAETAEGRRVQEAILDGLGKLDPDRVYMSRTEFISDLDKVLKTAGVKVETAVKKAVIAALSERDPDAEICADAKGNPEPDPDLRDNESVPLPSDVVLPLPIDYKGEGKKEPDNSRLVALVRDHCEAYFAREVAPHWPDAWIDFSKTRVGYEIPINRHFYIYEPPRPLDKIERDIRTLEGEILDMLKEVA